MMFTTLIITIQKKLIVFDDKIADIMTNRKLPATIKELFIRCSKLNCMHLKCIHSSGNFPEHIKTISTTVSVGECINYY